MAVRGTEKLAAMRSELETVLATGKQRGEIPPFLATYETVEVMLDMHDTVDALQAEVEAQEANYEWSVGFRPRVDDPEPIPEADYIEGPSTELPPRPKPKRPSPFTSQRFP